jgi:5-methylcytosine-specific restriction endonuclease McrA
MRYEFSTDGERLAYHVAQDLLNNVPWDQLAWTLMVTGRGAGLTEFFREISVVSLTCRIVRAGTSLQRATDQRPSRATDDPTFLQDYRNFCRQHVLVPEAAVDQLIRIAVRAVDASRGGISDTLRKELKRRAERTHPNCYMCGQALDFDHLDVNRRFELEHVWPQSYGGNSIEENLLPACGSCNRKKMDYATWGMVGIQSLILGINPTDNELATVAGHHRFALHYFAARKLVTRNPQKTLKWAFDRIRPWTKDVRAQDPADVADFFNLANYALSPGVL